MTYYYHSHNSFVKSGCNNKL